MSAISYDPRVFLYVNDEWVDVTAQVRVDSGIEWYTGRSDESKNPTPGWCKFVLDNSDGDFTPRNPMSPYAGSLNVNTPMTLVLDEITDTFVRPSDSDSWASTDTGESYDNSGSGGAVLATDFSLNGTQGIHSVPTTLAYRHSILNGATPAHNQIQQIRYIPQFSDVTGGVIEPANLYARWDGSIGGSYMCRVTVQTDETVTVDIFRGQSTSLHGAVTVPGVTHTAGQGIWIKFAAIDYDFMAKVWTGDDPEDEPSEWTVTVFEVSNVFGRYGVRSGVGGGNSNAKPVLFAYDNYTIWTGQFAGEIPTFPQTFSSDNVNQVVPIQAGGLFRRLTEGKGADFGSSARRWYTSQTSNPPTWYWPLDEGELSSVGRALVYPDDQGPEIGFVFNYNLASDPDSADQNHFAQARMGAWLPNGVAIFPDTTSFIVTFPVGSADLISTWFAIDFTAVFGSETYLAMNFVGQYASGVTVGGLDTDAYALTIDTSIDNLRITPGFTEPVTDISISSLSVNILDGAAHVWRFRVNQTGGTDINWQLFIDGVLIDTNIEAGHPMIVNFTGIMMFNGASATKPVGISNFALYLTTDPGGDQEDTYENITGNVGETAKERANRLLDEEGIPNFISGTGGRTMGPQYSDPIMSQLFEIMRTDGGLVRELLSARGIHYDTASELRSISVGLEIDVSNQELGPGFRPIDDTQQLRNKVRAIKRNSGDAIYELTTGRLSTADPKDGGVGVYQGGDVTCNPELEGDLVYIAEREVARGSVDKARFPELTVLLPSIESDLVLRRQVLDMYPTSRIKLVGMEIAHIYDEANLMVVGMGRRVTNHLFDITWNTTPYDSYDVFRVETEGSILGTDSSTVVYGVDSDDTNFSVVTRGDALWTTNPASFPILSRIGIRPSGEDILVTGVSTVNPSFLSVGTPSHADNASTSPGLPAGHVAGDTLILVSAIRTTSGTPATPAGWQLMYTAGNNFRVCAKVSTGGSEVAPTCTYTGGAAGDTTSSYIMAFQNMPFDFTDSYVATGVAQSIGQDITIPAITIPCNNGIILFLAWKQDDWTSVAVPSGFTEITETSTTTGNDQGLYAAYRVVPRMDSSPVTVLSVTGGAAAISKGITMHFTNPQTLTVTRSQNGVVRSWPADTEIRIAQPKVLG